MQKADILEVITLTGLGTIPYTVLDTLRLEHAIDVTGISLSQTHLGHLYRAHVLTTNTSADRVGDMGVGAMYQSDCNSVLHENAIMDRSRQWRSSMRSAIALGFTLKSLK